MEAFTILIKPSDSCREGVSVLLTVVQLPRTPNIKSTPNQLSRKMITCLLMPVNPNRISTSPGLYSFFDSKHAKWQQQILLEGLVLVVPKIKMKSGLKSSMR